MLVDVVDTGILESAVSNMVSITIAAATNSTTTASIPTLPAGTDIHNSDTMNHHHPTNNHHHHHRNMTIDPIEDRLGISTYLMMNASNNEDDDNNYGFIAISKARFSDFIVHEVSMDGTVAYLTSMEPIIVDPTTTTMTTTTTLVPVLDDGRTSTSTSATTIIIPAAAALETDTQHATTTTTGTDVATIVNFDDDENKNSTTDETTLCSITKVDHDDSSEPDSDNHKKRKLQDIEQEVAVEDLPKNNNVELEWVTYETELAKLIDNNTSVAKDVINFLQQHQQPDMTTNSEGNESNNDTEQHQHPAQQQFYVALPPLSSKEHRKNVHEYVKTRLHAIAAADTIDNGIIRIWHIKYRQRMPNKIDQYAHHKNNKSKNGGGDKSNATTGPPRDCPYLQFVLYKENMDTGLALQIIGQRANSFGGGGSRGRGGGGRGRGGPANTKRIRLGYAGNKDKRGVTCQYVTIPARDTSIKHLCNVFNGKIDTTTTNNNSDRNGSNSGGSGHTVNGGSSIIRIGNFQYVKDELRLGRLRGNRFEIALRNIRITDDDNDGTTTIGNSTVATTIDQTNVLTNAVHQLQQYGFINFFGVQRFGKYHNTHITGLAILRGDFQAAIDTIVCPPMVDDDIGTTAASGASDASVDVRDGSSYPMSNKTSRDDAIRNAQVQWKNRFQNMNDLSKEEMATCEQTVAKQTLSVMNHYMQSEIAILQSLIRHPCDYERAFGCITKTMRMMYIHAVQSLLWNLCATYRMNTYGYQVVVGDLVLYTNNSNNSNHGEGCPAVSVVTESDIAQGRYTVEDIVLPLIGIKTRNPDNSVGTYMNTLLTEQYNIRIEMMEEIGMTQRDFHCAGDYRKVLCRPTDVQYEIIQYRNELQPFIQTDYMKLNGIDVPHRCPDYSISMTPDNTNHPNNDGTNNESELPNGLLTGMTIRFTLPSSAYATICLRELMKRPTCSEYQRELQLGSCTKSHTPSLE